MPALADGPGLPKLTGNPSADLAALHGLKLPPLSGDPAADLSALGAPHAPYDALASLTPHPATPAAAARASRPLPVSGLPAAPRDVTQTPATSDRGPGTPENLTGIGGRILKNLVNPVMEQPISTMLQMGPLWPLGVANTAKGLAEQVGGYAGQKAAELTLPPDVRKMAEADPSRIQGADVATQVAALAALPLIHAGLGAVTPDVGPAVGQGFADLAAESKGTAAPAPEVLNEMFARRAAMARAAADAQEAQQAQTTQNTAFSDLLNQAPTGKVAAQVAKTAEPLPGLETNTGAVEDIASQKVADQVAAQAKAEADAAALQAQNEAAAKAQYEATLGSRTPLGVERGIVRRPGGVPVAEAPALPDLTGDLTQDLPAVVPARAQTALPPLSGDAEADLARATQPPIEPHPVEFGAFPEGFAMGGPESRVPEGVPAAPRGNPDVPSQFVTPEVENALNGEPMRDAVLRHIAALGDAIRAKGPEADASDVAALVPEAREMAAAHGIEPAQVEALLEGGRGLARVGGPAPEGVPKQVGPEGLVNRSKFAAAHQAALNEALASAYANGLDKRAVNYAEQTKVRQAFADAVGLDRLQLDPRAFDRLSGAQVVGLKDVLSRNFDGIETLTKALGRPGLSVGEAETINAEIDRLRNQNEQALQGIVRGSSAAGRDLNFLRQMANRTLDPDYWTIQAQRLAGDAKLSDETIADIRRLAREAAEICGA